MTSSDAIASQAGTDAVASGAERQAKELAKFRRDLLLSVLFTLPVFLINMVVPHVSEQGKERLEYEIVHGTTLLIRGQMCILSFSHRAGYSASIEGCVLPHGV